jgi:hypothetical protein
LTGLSRCACDTLKEFYPFVSNKGEGVPGSAIAVLTFSDFLSFNPHCHILVTDGFFYGESKFWVAPAFLAKELESLFRANVFKLPLKKNKINTGLIDMLKFWRHSGLNVY